MGFMQSTDGIVLVQNKDGTWSEKKEPYAIIECTTKEDFELIQRAVEAYMSLAEEERSDKRGK